MQRPGLRPLGPAPRGPRRYDSPVPAGSDAPQRDDGPEPVTVTDFLAVLERALQPIEEPEEIMRVAARMLGEHVRVDRSAYAEAEADEDHFTMTGSYARGLPPLRGRMGPRRRVVPDRRSRYG